jgi:hypothetical protein
VARTDSNSVLFGARIDHEHLARALREEPTALGAFHVIPPWRRLDEPLISSLGPLRVEQASRRARTEPIDQTFGHVSKSLVVVQLRPLNLIR